MSALYPSAPGTAKKENAFAAIDYSNISEGYVTVRYVGDPAKRCKVRITKDRRIQNFDVPGDGTPKVFPLTRGNGNYLIQVFQQVDSARYVLFATLNTDVTLRTPFVPFLYPNTYSDYGPNSKCVSLAYELCAGKKTDIDKLRAINDWIIKNIKYDIELAKRVQTEKWWLPCPDEVIETGKSICFGYASLLAAMCRSQGIPAKICVGMVKNAGKHAWNEVYIDKAWTHLDVTFAAGSNNKALDTSNYSVEYYG